MNKARESDSSTSYTRGMSMLKLKVICFAIMMSRAILASAETQISSRTVTVPVDITSAKVVKTNAGYGTTFLVKILVPALAEPTLMNHRNAGESAPCLATYDTDTVDDIVQGQPETLSATVKIDLVKSAYVDAVDHLCHVLLQETLSTKIRGFEFGHSRWTDLPTRDPGDC